VNVYTPTVEEGFDVGKELCASYFKGMFRIVKSVDKRPGDVAFYHIAVSKIVAPKINKHNDLTTWGGYITVGETDRVAAGGTAMANPTAGNVGTGVGDFNTKILTYSGLKEAFGAAGSELALTNDATDIVIKKVWDTVGTYYDEGTDSTKRVGGREYGIVYVSKVKKTFNLLILNNTTGAPIPDASIELVETGLTRVAGLAGTIAMISTITASATFLASAVGFADNQVIVVVEETTLSYNVTIRLTPLV